ncbi:valine--tRNA ligase [Brockia lithotrophica]|uniref:Valine--tRNA ligase n=1 Tax=Brockia lithotrophica TaxID=933949 RepID=A0A660LBW3_9BACL|nr:valine--tRNA ligase [Brockia lithotrophica]RKQ89110.1 valyl-tRNA synthetase [Brockia lithotrophica]
MAKEPESQISEEGGNAGSSHPQDAPASALPKTYNPREIEPKWAEFWHRHGLFTPVGGEERKTFSVVIPPPNVTGSLHLGHALNSTLQDIYVRYHRMLGYDALWLPGMDHAGIATQVVVERRLAQEGLTRHDLGREKFLERVWSWKEEYAERIRSQWRKLGLSVDFTRERFTLDEGYVRAIREVFVRLYEEGLIYRAPYIVHWDPVAQTVLSDLEVIYKEVEGKLYYVRYPLADGSGHIVVATTRPETMLGDVAIAVHPEDERYRKLVGKEAILPLVGRRLPILADDAVDPEFGTGAVKITPAHDPLDFEIGRRHGLEAVVVIDSYGRMNENAGPYRGLDRFACREKIAEDLAREGYLEKVERHVHAVGHSQRTDAVVEPYLSTQWFVRMKPLAERALAALREGRGPRFVPERFEKIYVHWLENVRDWVISRQLWWGHRIPAWYCEDCGATTVSREDVHTCPVCGSPRVRQEEDVLDTWFSSALWPFVTLGWPEETEDLQRFYPADLLVTGHDILFFWVARMVFMALPFTGKVPFRDVYLHGLIRDEEGRKMSKSVGNVVDPLEVVDTYGADALRFMLSTGVAPGQDMRFRWDRAEAARNFANKIWNATRFVLMNLGNEDLPFDLASPEGILEFAAARTTFAPEDRWILHRLAETAERVTELLERYEVGEAGRALYDFLWDEFCDWYVELAKGPIYDGPPEARRRVRAILAFVLDHAFRLLHPFMPFLTEELWQKLPHTSRVAPVLPHPSRVTSLVLAPWPTTAGVTLEAFRADADVSLLGRFQEIVRLVRNLRAEVGVPPQTKIPLHVRVDAEEASVVFRTFAGAFERLARAELVRVGRDVKRPPTSLTLVFSGGEGYVPLEDLVDLDSEIARLRRELDRLDGELERVRRKLLNPDFTARAPEEVVSKERAKEAEYRELRERVRSRLEELTRAASERRKKS